MSDTYIRYLYYWILVFIIIIGIVFVISFEIRLFLTISKTCNIMYYGYSSVSIYFVILLSFTIKKCNHEKLVNIVYIFMTHIFLGLINEWAYGL